MSSPHPLSDALAARWWAIVLRGLCSLLFGLFALLRPDAGLVALTLAFGIFILSDGILSILAAFRGDLPEDRGWLAVSGAVGMAAGAAIVLMPELTATLVVLFVAVWAMSVGGVEIAAAIKLRREMTREWLLVAAGVLSLLFGILIALAPAEGAFILVFLIAMASIVRGTFLISLGIRLRGWLSHHAAT